MRWCGWQEADLTPATAPSTGRGARERARRRALHLLAEQAYRSPARPCRTLTDASVPDIAGRMRCVSLNGVSYVLKRRSLPHATAEHAKAVEASRRLPGVSVPDVGLVEAIAPELFPLSTGEGVLATPYLGRSLASERRPFGTQALVGLLMRLLEHGVDWSGCIPRNLVRRSSGLALIDWEDARFAPAPTGATQVTLAKWDVAWSDVYGQDLRLRCRLPSAPSAEEPPLDDFERALREIIHEPWSHRRIRRQGIRLTLGSELHVPGLVATTAAELGHLAADVLEPRLELFHTAATAYLRWTLGDSAQARILQELADATRNHPVLSSGRPVTSRERAQIQAIWIRQLVRSAAMALGDTGDLPSLEALPAALERLRLLGEAAGWDAACARAEAALVILDAVTTLVTRSFPVTDCDLLVRGSAAQGVLGRSSDVDFEISSPRHPRGHRGAEGCVIAILGCLGLSAEGSEARPVEVDLRDPYGTVTRDLQEWCELRRVGSISHDPGWVAAALDAPSRQFLLRTQSRYERAGRQLTAKYLWFEARATVARAVFGLHNGPNPVTLAQQLRLLPALIPSEMAAELSALTRESFRLREVGDDAPCRSIARRLDTIRERLGLAGPSPGPPCNPSEVGPGGHW
jgi:hypothetical protein